MTRITVTGAAGFIGRRVVEQLRSCGHDVLAVIRDPGKSIRFDDEGVETLVADLAEPADLSPKIAEADLVIHLAGCTIERSRDEFRQTNLNGTVALAELCAAANRPPRFQFVSSLAAAGPALDRRAKTERDVDTPVSRYGQSKLDAENELAKRRDRLEIQVVRPPSVFGADDRFMLGLFKTGRWGWAFVPGRSTAHYSLVHVDDLAEAMIHLGLNVPIEASEMTYVAHDPPMSFPEIAGLVSETVGNGRLRTVHVPAAFCRALAVTNSAIAKMFHNRPLLNRDKIREGLAGSWICDASHLKVDCGFQFQVSLHERIRQTARAYRKAGRI